MDAPQHLKPGATEAGCRFIHAGGNALQGSIQAPLGHRQETIPVAPHQQGQGRQSQATAQQQKGQGQDGAWNRIPHARPKADGPEPGVGKPALGHRQHQGRRHGDRRGGQGQGKRVERQARQVLGGFQRELAPTDPNPQQGEPQAGQGGKQGAELGQALAPALQGPAAGWGTLLAGAPQATAAAKTALRHHQAHHDHHGDQGQANRSFDVAVSLPTVEDARREGGDAEELNGAKLIHHFHAGQGHARTNRWHRHRQGHPPKTPPRPDPQGTGGVLQPSAAEAKTLRTQQKHIAVGGQAQHQHGPGQAMDPPAHPAAQIHQGGGQQVTRNRQRQELGNLQPAATWKVAAGRQPAIGRTQAGPQHPNANQQQQGVLDLFTATGAKGQQASPATATRHQQQRPQR